MRLSDYLNSLTDENMTNGLERDEEGNLTIRVDSSMLPGVNVDTYQCFSGDSWMDSELDYLSIEGVPDWMVDHPTAQRATVEWGVDDFDWTHDHQATLRTLAEVAAEDLVDSGGITFDQIITGAEVLSVWSPAAYNFATDSFDAQLTLDTEALAEALDDIDVDELEAWARDRWASRDGFMSSIPRYFDTETEWATVWAAVAKVLIDSDYDGFMAVAEAEHEAYSEHTAMELNSRGAGKVWTACTGTEVPEDADLHDAESLTVALHDALPMQEEELPITA